MTVFFKKGVPDSIRNAALRKSWALDPAIRNYVNPALDYAYDWNTPGGVPGGGELAPGTDIARMVSQIMGEQPAREVVDKTGDAETHRRGDAPDHVAEHHADATRACTFGEIVGDIASVASAGTADRCRKCRNSSAWTQATGTTSRLSLPHRNKKPGDTALHGRSNKPVSAIGKTYG